MAGKAGAEVGYQFNAYKKVASLRLSESEKQAMLLVLLEQTKPVPKLGPAELLAVLGEWDEAAAEAVAAQDELIGLSTGYQGLDQMVMGLAPGQVTVVAARTSHGKTQLACNIAYRVASRGVPVAFVTLEMTKVELATRFQLLNGGPVADLPVIVQRPERVDAAELKAMLAAAKAQGCQLAVIDHLHYLVPRGDNQANVVGEISRQIKQAAMELDLPVLLLAQMNREGSKADELSMYHIKDSGYVEQDADVVLLLQRGDPEGKGTLLADELLVKMAKNRTRGMNRSRMCTLYVGLDGVTLREFRGQPFGTSQTKMQMPL